MKSTPYIHACLCMYVNINTCTQYNAYLIELYIYISCTAFRLLVSQKIKLFYT